MFSPFSRRRARERLDSDRRRVDKDNLKEVVDKADLIEQRFRSSGPLGRFIGDGKMLLALVQDYANGRYRQIPWRAIAAVVAALLYVLNPLDLVPDFIPLVGWLDDGAILAACLMMIEGDLHAYRKWKVDRAHAEDVKAAGLPYLEPPVRKVED